MSFVPWCRLISNRPVCCSFELIVGKNYSPNFLSQGLNTPLYSCQKWHFRPLIDHFYQKIYKKYRVWNIHSISPKNSKRLHSKVVGGDYVICYRSLLVISEISFISFWDTLDFRSLLSSFLYFYVLFTRFLDQSWTYLQQLK